ncbi:MULTISPECIES: Nif3-like dinuclear metal center hexameric protein [unclassified Marinobacterium]|uniref:Nif3-like dinuclear metal center hexameric protein n=1 Tax=unclassified Marinobacterium TaxID=2644139 RepID=UPI00156A2EC7|nr:putative GTP cyclohydrolase 1 type 2 [Marinobacterium sp. xm-g-59]NRQ00931.1 putative GTP cyclohydrolase 1 type 2 [Marinobacterium sp. xm-d-530]
MSVALKDLVSYCNDYLSVDRFKDYCPNGLQVEGKRNVSKIVSGVTASKALIDAAVEAGADLLLVHHGYFWKGESEPLTGIKGNRIRTLMKNDISLLAYHLPLDAHPVVGNNAQLAEIIGIQIEDGMDQGNPFSVGNVGSIFQPMSAQSFSDLVSTKLSRQAELILGDDRSVQRIAWCTGSAERMIERADQLGADLFISGEISEPVVHYAREAGIHYLSAGHHATERYGAKALGEHLSKTFGIEHQFIDIDNPA